MLTDSPNKNGKSNTSSHKPKQTSSKSGISVDPLPGRKHNYKPSYDSEKPKANHLTGMSYNLRSYIATDLDS